jgi:AraC-like DNA-binding protein
VPSPSPSPNRVDIDTEDPEEAHGYLRRTYVDHSVQFSGDPERFRFRHRMIDDEGFFVSRYEHSMSCRVDTEPFGYLLIGQMFGGQLRLSTGQAEITPGTGEMFLIDPAAPMRIEWEDFRSGLVRLDLDIVNRVATEITGVESSSPVHFGLARVDSPERARNWQGLVRYLTHDFFRSESAHSSPLIHAQTLRLLAVTVLETFPNTALGTGGARPGEAGPSAVRRAVAFIDEHAGEPIGLTEIAAAARLGPRALQEAFRRHRGTTPTAYLRRVRLERAHRDLQGADPTAGATVAAIATRWGFAHHGRFAALYRNEYGGAPSETLAG